MLLQFYRQLKGIGDEKFNVVLEKKLNKVKSLWILQTVV